MARMSLDTAIRLSAEVKGGGNIDRVKKSLQDLGKNSQVTAREMQTLRAATFQFARANDSTIAGIRSSIGAFRGLQEQAKIGSREFQRYGAEIQRLEAKLKGLDGTARQTNTRLGGLAAAAGRLIAAYAGFETLRFVFARTAELESQTRSLQVLTGSAESAKQIIQELQQLGAVTPFTSAELIDTAKRLQAFGVETEKVVDITRRLADVSGATGAELAGLATAYGQVQAKGRLQGEELLQFQERGVALQEILRKEYGLTGVEFQKALEKGQISAEAVEYALKKLTDTGGKYANGAIAQSDTLNGRMSTLIDGIEQMSRTIGTTLSPAIKAVINEAIAGINYINSLMAMGARAQSFGLGQQQRQQILQRAQAEAEQIVNLRRIADPFERNRQFQELVIQRERDLIEQYGYQTGQIKPPAAAPQQRSALPSLTGGTTGGTTTGSGRGRAAGKTDQERAAEQLKRNEAAAKKELEDFVKTRTQGIVKLSEENELLNANTDIDRRRLEYAFEQAAIQKRFRTLEQEALERRERIAELGFEYNVQEEQALINSERQAELDNARLKYEQDINRLIAERIRLAQSQAAEPAAFDMPQDVQIESNINRMAEELREMTSIATLATRSAEGIGNAFGNAFRDLITGAASARQVLSGFFEDVAQSFAEMAAEIIAKQMTMIALQTILKALGAVAGAAGGGSADFAPSDAGPFGAGGVSPDLSFDPSQMVPRALGGPVSPGRPYSVGEQGPELFVPSQAGTIIPAEATEALQAINNASMRGLQVPFQGSSSSSSTTLREVPFQRGMEGLAVPFQRSGDASGGMGGGAGSIDVKFETVRIGELDFVTRDEAQRIGRESAKQGAELAQKRIRNNPSTRRQAGIG